MAELLLAPLFKRLLDVLSEEFRSWKRVDKEAESLKEELVIIQALVKDAEAKLERGDTSNVVKAWLNQMRELGNCIEDVVDDFLQYVEQQRDPKGAMKTLKLHQNTASKITNIIERIHQMKNRAQIYGLLALSLQGSTPGRDNTVEEDDALRLNSLCIEKDELVGIDATSKVLVDKLVQESSNKRMIISLVGEGGIGKTTLAKIVYDNEVVEAHFDCRAWITVSQSCDTKTLLGKMIKQIFPDEKDHQRKMERSPGEQVVLLRQHLKRKKYVVVFDDVWRQDFWGVIKQVVPAGENQGRIILTTRDASVANAFREASDAHLVQELRPWSEELALTLFCKTAFSRKDIEEQRHEELKQLSLEFVSKCQGLPLVIAAIGSLLSRKEKVESVWRNVLDDFNSESMTTYTGTSKILSLSYFDLPDHLKRCFLYFGIFPEDVSILDVTLYKLWIAEGFIEAQKNKTLEKVSEEYLNQLIQRNLVAFDVSNELERRCRVHDLMREIIESRAEETSFFQILDKKETTLTKENCRRLAIYNTTERTLENVEGDGLHSISIFNVDKLTKPFLVTLLKRFKHLRVLNFHRASLDELPDEMGNLFHLKYLSLGDTKVKTIPKSIGKLPNLLALDIRYSLVNELPSEINKLRKLRHLLGFSFEKNSFHGVRIQGGVGELSELHALSMVKARSSGDRLMMELEKLTQMRQLGITELTRETGRAVCAAIEKMINLKCIDLHAINEDEILDIQHIRKPDLRRLEYLALQGKLEKLPAWIPELKNLQKLALSCARLTDEPLTSLKDMPHLVYLNLDAAYDGEELHFEKGGFQKLKKLNLKNLRRLKLVKIDVGALSLLEKLEIGPSHELKEVPNDFTNLGKLKYLDIWGMPTEFVAATKPGGLNIQKIKHVDHVRFWRKQGDGNYVEDKLPLSHPVRPNIGGGYGYGR